MERVRNANGHVSMYVKRQPLSISLYPVSERLPLGDHMRWAHQYRRHFNLNKARLGHFLEKYSHFRCHLYATGCFGLHFLAFSWWLGAFNTLVPSETELKLGAPCERIILTKIEAHKETKITWTINYNQLHRERHTHTNITAVSRNKQNLTIKLCNKLLFLYILLSLVMLCMLYT